MFKANLVRIWLFFLREGNSILDEFKTLVVCFSTTKAPADTGGAGSGQVKVFHTCRGEGAHSGDMECEQTQLLQRNFWQIHFSIKCENI